jgi:hypothetical protein
MRMRVRRYRADARLGPPVRGEVRLGRRCPLVDNLIASAAIIRTVAFELWHPNRGIRAMATQPCHINHAM